MTTLSEAISLAGPIYNLIFVAIATLLFIKLFTKFRNRVYTAPWKWLCVAMGIFVFETVFTIFRANGLINVPVHVNGFFELAIVSLVIYTLLLQREHVILSK